MQLAIVFYEIFIENPPTFRYNNQDEFDCLIDNCVLEDAVSYLWLIATGKVDSKRNTFDSLRFIDQVHSLLKAFDSVSSVEEA